MADGVCNVETDVREISLGSGWRGTQLGLHQEVVGRGGRRLEIQTFH